MGPSASWWHRYEGWVYAGLAVGALAASGTILALPIAVLLGLAITSTLVASVGGTQPL